MKRFFSLLALVSPLLGTVSETHAAEPVPRPNIVFLLVDDLRWNALGCMGDSIVQTPHIDSLARRGTLFHNAFVTTSICSVSRATFFTGQWMRRHGIEDFAKGLNGEAWRNSYPSLLRAAGYRTGFIGKYGVGNNEETAAKAAEFDYWRGLPGQAGRFFIEKDDPTRKHKTARFGDQALEFLAGCQSDQPFCLSLSFNAVHARDHELREYEPDPRDEKLYDGVEIPLPRLATEEAFQRVPEFVKKSEGRTRWGWRFDSPAKAQGILRDYYRLITGVDREVGRILAELERRGLARNTVIIFTSDNGYALADRGLADKWFMWEEDVRVPLIIVDPRLPPAAHGKTVNAMALNVDLAPTILDFAGIPAPATMQGRSLVPLLGGAPPPPDWRTDFFYEHHSVADRIPQSEGIRTEQWKYIRWVAATPIVEELYDLSTDPLEEHNLIHEAAHQQTLAALRARWAALKNELK